MQEKAPIIERRECPPEKKEGKILKLLRRLATCIVAGTVTLGGIEAMVHIEKEERKSEFLKSCDELDERLYLRLGEVYINRFKSNLSEKSRGNEEDTQEEGIQLSAIETKEGVVSAEDLRKILKETYPQKWVEEEIFSIVEVKESEVKIILLLNGIIHGFGLDGNTWRTLAYCQLGVNKERSRIVFLKEACETKMLQVMLGFLLAHEMGHANDWENDRNMSMQERKVLLLAILDRLQEEDRYRSMYVEAFSSKNLYQKAKEYWAIICAQYFMLPEVLDKRDFLLVHDVVKRSDPGFDVFLKSEERRKMISLLMKKSHEG